jgi:hypothetical protein
VIERVPAASADVTHCAWPETRVTVAQIVVVPSLNVTVPVGVPLLPLTVAVNVTDCPAFDGFVPDATEVVLANLDASKAPRDGGFGRVVPSRSVDGAPVAVPLPFAGDAGVIRRLSGAAWNSGSPLMKLLPTESPLLNAPGAVLPKNRLLASEGALLYDNAP